MASEDCGGLSSESQVSALGCSLRSGDSNRGEFFADRIGCIIQQPAKKLGAAVQFITERLVFLAVFLDCPSVRKVPRQDSSTSPDRGWAVSLRRGDLLVSPAHAGCPDRFGMEEYVGQQTPTAARELSQELDRHRSQAGRARIPRRNWPVQEESSKWQWP